MDYSAQMVFLGFLGTLIVAISTSVWGILSWLGKQFSSLRTKIDDNKDLVLAKLDYHEKHDDQRFGRVSDDIWMLRLLLNAPIPENKSGNVRRETSSQDISRV